MFDPLLARIDEVLAERLAAQGAHNDDEALSLEESFIDFVAAAWPNIDPAEFQRSFVVEAMAEHLQAVADGQIKRLLINVPPRSRKPSWPPFAFLLGYGASVIGLILKGLNARYWLVLMGIACLSLTAT